MSHRELAKNTLFMTIAVFFSRILGLLRDLIFAGFFGTSYIADAFNLAFILPNLLRRLFGEGALSAAFIPLYNEIGIKRGKKDQIHYGIQVVSVLSIFLVILSLIGTLLAPLIVRIFAPGFDEQTAQLTVKLARIMFPYLFLVGVSSTLIAILNSHGHFFIPGLSSAFFNIGMIATLGLYALLKPSDMNVYAVVLSYGVLLGGVLQTVVNFPQLKRHGYRIQLSVKGNTEAMGQLWNRFLPGVVGIAILQINLVVDRMLASYLPEGSISSLTYAYRLMQLPLGMFGVAAGTAAIPEFSRLIVKKEWPELSSKIRFASLSMVFLMIPVTAFIAASGQDIIRVIFMRGAFDAHALAMTTPALVMYSAGLVFFSVNRILVPVFHAHGNTRTPVIISGIATASNIVLNLILMQFLAHVGLALATSLSAVVQTAILIILIKKKYPYIHSRSIVKESFYIMILGVLVYAAKVPVALLITGNDWLHGAIRLALHIALSIVIILPGLRLMGLHLDFKRRKLTWKKST